MTRYNKEDLSDAVNNSSSIKESLEKLGLRAAGGNYKIFHTQCKKWNIDISHFMNSSQVANKNWQDNKFAKLSLDEILVENSNYSRASLKRRLYKEGVKKPFCEMEGCGQGEIWLGNKISMIIDHINGVWNDNRLENIRIVCPMCNAALPTHAGRNIRNKKSRLPKEKFKEKTSLRKVKRPSKEELKKLLWEFPTTQIAKLYGVSDKAVEKWARSNGLEKPRRGYWTTFKLKKP